MALPQTKPSPLTGEGWVGVRARTASRADSTQTPASAGPCLSNGAGQPIRRRSMTRLALPIERSTAPTGTTRTPAVTPI